MEIAGIILFFALGIVLIVKGGDWFVDAASWIARVSGVPRLIIGATVVSLATTLPELLVSINAAHQGKVDMSVGNAVGSVTANIGLIMAIALLFMPMVIKRRDYMLKGLLMLAGIGVIWAFTAGSGSLGILPVIILIIIFVISMSDNVRSAVIEMKEHDREKRTALHKKEVLNNIIKFIAGVAAIVIGSDLLVDYGSALARMLGVSEGIISVTVIAVGTSLPELVTAITAIIKKEGDLSVGNIIGANIMDLTMILPACALIYGGPLPLSQQSIRFDLPACLLVAIVALLPSLITKKFARWQGVLLLIIYILYVIFSCTGILTF